MLDEEELRDRLDGRLMGHGVYLTEFEAGEDGLRVTYETATPGTGVPHREIGRVLNVLRDLREEGWKPVDVRGTVLDLDGDLRGTWFADAAWLRALETGDLDEVAFSRRVLDTVEER